MLNRTIHKEDLRTLMTLPVLFALLCLYSCASIGTPSGGPRDEEPPRYVGSDPLPYSVNFSGEKVQIEFDELVDISDAFTNVTFSPPSRQTPKVSASSKRIVVQFGDSLLPNTTYNIDFGNSIADVNEGNKIQAFSFSFSTGGEIDTLMMSGMVLDAQTLEPQQGVLVGAYTNLEDSAFLKLPFERATKTDDRGRFVLRGLKAVPYRVFALEDLNNDYHWDNPAELMAFLPNPVTPRSEQTTAVDTTYDLLGRPDSIVTRARTRFLPNDLLLQMFDFGYRPQYITDYSRPDSTRLDIIFNQRQDTMPELNIILPALDSPTSRWYMAERNERNDTLRYWLAPELIGIDTIKASLSYAVEQRGEAAKTATDTLTFITKRPKAAKPRKMTPKQQHDDSVKMELGRFIVPEIIGRSPLDVHKELTLQFPEPLTHLDTAAIRLEQFSPDSVWLPVAIAIKGDGMVPRRLSIDVPWEYGADYRLTVDSLAARGLSGRMSRSYEQKFSSKKRDSYASLILRLNPDTIPGFVEVLNTSDVVVQRASVVDGIASFYFLSPTDYYARFVADANGNGRFDAGDYENGIQPEEVFYYPKMLSLKRYDRNEQWNLYSTAVDMQKPDKIKKNRPKSTDKGSDRKNTTVETDEDDDYFDVTRNPFDPNDKGSSQK